MTLLKSRQITPALAQCGLVIGLLLPVHLAAQQAARAEPLRYTLDARAHATHVFDVTLDVDSLPPSGLFQFASSAPGTYQVMDIGRFVRGFQAFDRAGAALAVSRVSTNVWRVDNPRRVRRIHYGVMATRDTTVTENPVYAMAGSTLRPDYAMINGQALFGFPQGMQAAPVSLRLLHPTGWQVATAMDSVRGLYRARSFDHLVDSPIFAGNLTRQRVIVSRVPVDIVVYSEKGSITASDLGRAMSSMLYAAGAFIGQLPVNRYTFLFEFAETTAGAWEHSFSSEYVLPDRPYTDRYGMQITDIAAHEFFHIVTPLTLHSEIVGRFNFATPIPSQHLWLYEGATEWAAHKMLLESGLKMPETYLASVITKARNDRTQYDSAYSLSKLALTSYSDSGQRQYPNIYQRGAVVAGLLDIKLLELSQGRRGLKHVIADLRESYGTNRSFPEDSFFTVMERRTSPEIGDFLRRYVRSAEPLPLAEYYGKLGITLVTDSLGLPSRFDVSHNPTPEQLRLRSAWLGRLPIVP